MRRQTSSRHRPTPGVLGAAAAAGLLAFAFTWLLLAPAAHTPVQPTAVVRQRHRSDLATQSPPEQAVAELLAPHNLGEAIQAARFQSDDQPPATSAELIERTRENLRIDFGLPDEAGMQTIVLRWAGRLPNAGAARLLNVLARRLAAQPANADLSLHEARYHTAQQAVQAARQAVEEIRRQLDAAIAADRDGGTATPSLKTAPMSPFAPRKDVLSRSERRHLAEAKQAMASVPAGPLGDDRFLLQQRLLELETRRQTLAERLMPEHPEMKAIDEKIASMRTSLSHRPPPQVEPMPDDRRNADEPQVAALDRARTAGQVQELGQALLAAQDDYTSACDRERACWRALEEARGTPVTEIEQASAETVDEVKVFTWQRWLVSTLTALACGGLVLATWPVRRANFATVEEVRTATHLPVIVVGRGSLN